MVDTGDPLSSRFWSGALAPFGPRSLLQSGRASWMPSGLNGLPQWNLPPMNSYAVRWPWASSVPLTSPSRVAPRNAGVRAPALASGKRAHTPVRTKE